MASGGLKAPALGPPFASVHASSVLSGARDADRAISALAQECDDLLHGLLAGERLRDVADPLLQCAAAVEQHLVGAPELVDRLVREAPALEADDIEAGQGRAIAKREAKGNDVMLDAREAADERVSADANELMRRSAPADIGEIADLAMPRQHDIIGQNDPLADPAIMPDMRVGQKCAARADERFRPAAGGARIHRHAFANEAVFADGQAIWLAAVFEVLRRMPDRGEGENDGARADRRVAGQAHVGDQSRAVAERRLRPDMAERPNLHVRPEPRAVLDDGGRMDRYAHSRTSMADTSASQTSTPSTFASPRYHHMLRRLATRVMWNRT